MIHKKFQHKYIKNLTCIVMDYTKKGYKVQEQHASVGRKKARKKIAYYFDIDFDSEKGIWLETGVENITKEQPINSSKNGCFWDNIEDY